MLVMLIRYVFVCVSEGVYVISHFHYNTSKHYQQQKRKWKCKIMGYENTNWMLLAWFSKLCHEKHNDGNIISHDMNVYKYVIDYTLNAAELDTNNKDN